jgi:hypothetical protein
MVVLSQKNFDSQESYSVANFSATVSNNSSLNLISFEILISIEDCLEKTDCPVIYRKNENIYLPIPAGEKRAFNQRVYLNDIPPLTQPTVSIKVTSTISE